MMQTHLIVGVMGGGMADRESADAAYRLGSLIAAEGWILLNGGRNEGSYELDSRLRGSDIIFVTYLRETAL